MLNASANMDLTEMGKNFVMVKQNIFYFKSFKMKKNAFSTQLIFSNLIECGITYTQENLRIIGGIEAARNVLIFNFIFDKK